MKKKKFQGGDSTRFFDQLPPQLLVPLSVAGLAGPSDRIAWEVVVDLSDHIAWGEVIDPLDHA